MKITLSPFLESMLEEKRFEDLPFNWRSLDIKKFSKNKELWDFQQEAVKNAITSLYLYYKEDDGDKSKFYQRYILNGLDPELERELNIDVSKLKNKLFELIRPYYSVKEDSIHFLHFINRAAFWMATGSGKTLVIIKLIEVLKRLMDLGEIPKKDILFLTHREDLINQFKKHVDEFNELYLERGFKINLRSLADYEKVKKESLLPFFNEITIFYYKSDNISDEQKEKLIDFRNYENGGNWYIILDEAHKGDKEESKRQFLYSIMARNGFLFNFSATFVDPRDIITTAFNFNLEKFISEGYGKHLYILQQEIKAFKEKGDYNRREKKKIVLKALVLLTYIKKIKEKVRKIHEKAYHEPLMLTLVNTVNLSEIREEESDLKLFFNELESIGKGEVDADLLKESIDELIAEFSESSTFIYENIPLTINIDEIKQISFKDVLHYIYNSNTPGNIEALTIPERRQEVVFKLKTSDKPFVLVKIGDAIRWIKENLKGYEVNESYEDKSIFENLENKDEINILVGSRAFYEGWDSNRPNLLLFINIGVGNEARKFVIQSIGRGVRIEPIKNKRRRLKVLFNKKEDEGLLSKLENESLIQPLETLFIFGTNRNVLTEVIKHLEIKKKLESIINLDVDPKVLSYDLPIPVYKEVEEKLYLHREPQKFIIAEKYLQLLNEYFNSVDERVIIVSYDMTPEMFQHIKNTFLHKDKYYKIANNQRIPLKRLIPKLIRHFNLNLKEVKGFKKLDNEIVHFKNIKHIFNNYEEQKELEEKISKVKNFQKKSEEEKLLEEKYGKISKKEYDELLENISKEYPEELTFKDLKIKYVIGHYYNPVLLSMKEKIRYMKNVIKVKSEVNFINKLDEYVKNNKLNCDFWVFSKIDEILDKVYIPYYDPSSAELREFYPDFIFWIKKGDTWIIIFVDPKGIKHTEFEYKVDGFKLLYEEAGKPKVFKHGNLKIIVLLYLYTEDKNLLPEGYRKYWFDNFDSIFKIEV